MERFILHADLNAFYANIECLYRRIHDKPLAVTGDPELRLGIILTKNQIAKKFGVKTGESVPEAKRKCPHLILVKADYPLYLRFSQEFHRDILGDYSERVESYGLDEAWVDISSQDMTWAKAKGIADEIRARTIEELGLTASVGVSFTKPFAKLGSDYKKPDATTVISRRNFEEIVWPLPASELLFVGPATTEKLSRQNILTIGDLANANTEWLQYKLGKNGLLVQSIARGEDLSPVQPIDVSMPVKSVGNSTTTPMDITNFDDLKCVYHVLADSVAARLRENGFRSRCISISVRTSNDLEWRQCQKTIREPTLLARDIVRTALTLFQERNFSAFFPLRSLGLQCSQLTNKYDPVQMDMLGVEKRRIALEGLEETIRYLQDRYGPKSIVPGGMMLNTRLKDKNPREHFAPASPYFAGS